MHMHVHAVVTEVACAAWAGAAQYRTAGDTRQAQVQPAASTDVPFCIVLKVQGHVACIHTHTSLDKSRAPQQQQQQQQQHHVPWRASMLASMLAADSAPRREPASRSSRGRWATCGGGKGWCRVSVGGKPQASTTVSPHARKLMCTPHVRMYVCILSKRKCPRV